MTPTTTAKPSMEEVIDPVHGDKGTAPGEGLRMLTKYLDATIRYEASDLIVKVDLSPRIRLRGALKSLQTDKCSEQLMFQIAKDVLDEKQYEYFHHHGSRPARFTVSPATWPAAMPTTSMDCEPARTSKH